ncbi:hypothetical protein LTR50_007444 [Elasticomyces elasticus]|nr:hypothetical protein LTR50_007444 [Elasticomyces elasticus]
MVRAERVREAEDRKVARAAARKLAKEERAVEKARRTAAKAAQRAKKLEEAAKRKEDAAREDAQRMAAKRAEENNAKSKKWRFVGEEPGAASKRRCAKPSTPYTKQESADLRRGSSSLGSQPQIEVISNSSTTDSVVRRWNAG